MPNFPKTRIEARTLEIIGRVIALQPVEDFLVECKAAWIEPKDGARRLAGHANAARGEPILWLVGVDEKSGRIPGVQLQDLAAWWDQVRSHFDGLAPDVLDVNVPYDGVTVVAMCFETGRAPFVVKNPNGGRVSHEVPWREGTSIRSSRRHDLVRLLVPTAKVPECEVLSAVLRGITAIDRPSLMTLEVRMYVVPRSKDQLCIPFHRCEFRFRTGTRSWIVPEALRIEPSYEVDAQGASMERSHTVRGTNTEVLFDGPGLAFLRGNFESAWPIDTALGMESNLGHEESLELEARLGLTNGSYPVVLLATLASAPSQADALLRWIP